MEERELPEELTKDHLKEGDRVMLDREFRNRSKVTIVSFTPRRLYATVRSDEGAEWQTMTNRLSELSEEEKASEKLKLSEEELRDSRELLTLMATQGKSPGKIVRTKKGKIGLTKNSDESANGKILVYTADGNRLCSVKNLDFVGFHD